MGAIRPQAPNQEQCPWTLSVGAPHTRHDGAWAVTIYFRFAAFAVRILGRHILGFGRSCPVSAFL